jgi:two-component system chemotaxis response regulator CheB
MSESAAPTLHHVHCSLVLADDSVAYRKALAAVLLRERGITILGEADDGQVAVELVSRLRPDLALLDIVMPHMDGIEAARRIVDRLGIPVLLMSALARYPDQRPDLAGLDTHLVELIEKPVLVGPAAERSIAGLLARIKSFGQAPSAASTSKVAVMRPGEAERRQPPMHAAVVLIAASTGGIGALRSVLGGLAAPFPPIVIAQHLDPLLSKQLAVLLHDALGLPVVTVEHSAPLQDSRLYVAAPARHLLIGHGQVLARWTDAGELAPSADQLFTSAAAAYGARAVGVVLTGMGDDGAAGLRRLRDTGGWTVVQDPASAVVDAMPRAACEKQASCEVLPLSAISERLAKLAPLLEGPI